MSIFHLKWPHMKHEENSLRGIEKAARRRDDEIDIDLQMTKDGVIVGCHWPRPMVRDGFHDPKHCLRRTRTVRSMTWEQVKRLRTRKGNYHISRIESLLKKCAEEGVIARLEPKGDKRFEDVEVWREVKAEAKKHGAKVRGYSLRNSGGRGAGVRRVAAMKKAGIPSKVIH